jgi:hypothetical protein
MPTSYTNPLYPGSSAVSSHGFGKKQKNQSVGNILLNVVVVGALEKEKKSTQKQDLQMLIKKNN